eukprot:Em0001g1982a
MGNRESPARKNEQSEELQNSATAHSDDNSAIAAAASLPKRERELGLTWVPETIADLQDEVQDQFNIPVFDQKLTFGPTTLSSKESIQSYSLRSGDSITVEYTTEADVAVMLETVTFLQKTLTFLESIEPQLLLFPISPELQASLQTEVDVTQFDAFRNAIHSAKSPKRQIADAILYIKAGGLNLLQRLHSATLQLPFKAMPLQVQLLEFQMCQMMWTLSSHTETEAAVLEELKLDNIVQSLFRVSLLPNATISPPPNPHTEWLGDIQLEVINNLIITSTGCLTCVLEYESPNIQIDLASNPKFLEQIEGALQSLPASFKNSYLLAMSLLPALAYNLDTHRYLCKPHVIQSIIRTWKNADPTPENNATRGESVYLNDSHRRTREEKDVDQGLMDYVICLPSVLPVGSRAQQRAKDLVTMLGKEMHLQPPSLNTMARARLAATHFGLDRVLKAPVQELLSEVY